jgi:tetratricopeptide (TPR) repeat protein
MRGGAFPGTLNRFHCVGGRVLACTLLGALLCCGRAWAAAPTDCGGLENAYGPYDYSDPSDRATRLPIVEQFHFTPSVENLVAGRSDTLQGDLDYTLRAFPNHVRALNSMARLQTLDPQIPQHEARIRTIDCYFDRAMRWRPSDGMVRLVYAIYLHRRGKLQEALTRYQEAEQLIPDAIEVHYNLGLLYVDLGKLDLAKAEAGKAYGAGYPLQGLRHRIERLESGSSAASPGANKKAAREP